MNAIESTFPKAQNLLCQWHIQKNLLAKCKHYFSTEILGPGTTTSSLDSTAIDPWTQFQRTWTALIHTQTVDEFDEA